MGHHPNVSETEHRVAKATRRYEQVKLALMVAVLLIDIAIGVYLIGIARSNKQSLTILQCAVAHSTSFDSHNHLRTPAQVRTAFDKCVG